MRRQAKAATGLLIAALALAALGGCDGERKCKDGTATHSVSRGACSGHGGLDNGSR